MKISQLKELVKQVVKEENDYQQLFKHMLDKTDKSITNMSDDEKKKFFNAVDTAYKAKSEGKLRGYNEGVSEGLSKDAIVRTLTRDKNAYYLSKDGNGWILDITPKAAQQSTFHQKFDVKDMGKGHLGMKYKLSELTAGQKKIDVDKDGEIEGSDLAALRAGKTNEASTSSAPGAWVAYLSMTRGKKLLKTFDTARGAKQYLSKNVDRLLDGSNVESVGIMTKQQWDEREAKYAIESIKEAENSRFPSWPPVLDKFNTKEIQKLEADYKASLDRSSAILKKQWELINKGYPSDFPWENYDKWPAKLKAEVEKLSKELEKSREKQPEMFKKLMQARGTWR
jgi:hypothetical protein